MAFNRPTLPDLITRIQEDFISRLSLEGALLRRSLVAVMARVWAGAAHMMHGHLEYLSRQVFPDQADAEFLERHAALYGITRTPATFAAGNVNFSGTNGSVIPAGTVLQRSDGIQYQTDAEAMIAAGTATAAVTAATAGSDGNADPGVSLAIVSPIAGVNSSATVADGGLTGGVDTEDDDGLRTRLLERLQEPPQGGSEADYIAWAKEVSGVTRVWVYPQELGIGTVVVRFMRDNDPDPIPDGTAVAAVQAYIDERRPITADVTVVAPIAAELDLTITLTPDTQEVRAAVEAELEAMLARDAEPGGIILLSRIQTAIGIAAGVQNFVLHSPTQDIQYSTGHIPVLGTITWQE